MENKSHYIVAVTFLVVFSAGAVVFFLWLAQEQPTTRTYEIITGESVGQLHGEASVKFKGLAAGKVQSVGFDPDNPDKVRIVIGVYDNIPITSSTYAQVGSMGLIGTTVVKLKNPNPDASTLKTSKKHPARIPMHPGFMTRVKKSVSKDMDKVSAILDRMDKMLDSTNRKHISQTLAQLDKSTKKLVKAEKAIMPALQDMPELTGQARASLEKTQKLIRQLQRLVSKAGKTFNKASDVEDSVRSLSASAHKVTRRLNNQTLPQASQLMQSLDQLTQHIDALSNELQRKPQSVIFGPPKTTPGPGEPGFDDSQ